MVSADVYDTFRIHDCFNHCTAGKQAGRALQNVDSHIVLAVIMAVAADLNDVTEKKIGWIKKRFFSCFKGVKLLRTLIILVCFCVVVQQISSCIRKLVDIPVTTYTHFDFNKTITYPSVTFCREPAYKFNKMLEYNLYSHPRYTSVWALYNYSISLDDLWQDITFTADDFFVQYGLDGSPDNVEIQETIGFLYGRCYTLIPKVEGHQASLTRGYSVTLKHTEEDLETASGVNPPGYQVYVHYTREPFTEVEVYNGGLVQFQYISVGETMSLKLTVDEYQKISRDNDPCTFEKGYSANRCTAQCVWDAVSEQAGCSGPWMSSNLPRCSNYTAMRTVISSYMNMYQAPQLCFCPRFCKSYMYNSFVTNRQILFFWDHLQKMWRMDNTRNTLETQIFIYFNSMMVSVYEEAYTYDWNLFISDLGGSIGFLLGLSMISLIQIFGKTWKQFIRPIIRCWRCKGASRTGSIATVDVATVKYYEGTDWRIDY